MSLLRASLAATVFVSSFAACSPSDGGGADDGGGSGDGGSSPGGASGTGGTSGVSGTAGASPSGGAGGTSGAAPTGGASGTGLGGSAGTPASGGTAGASGNATGGGAGLGGGVGGDGASGTAGVAGDSGSGPGGAGGTTGAYTGTIIVQDDFNAQANGAAPDSAKWQLYPDYAPAQQPIVDSTRSHSPPTAAKTRGNPSFLIPKQATPLGGMTAPGNKFYIRVWVNFEKTTAMVGNHSTFLVGSVAKDNSGTELRLGFSSNQSGKPEMLDLNLQNATDGGEVTRYSNGFTDGGNPGAFSGMGVQFNANQWYCMEALFDGMGSEFRLWVGDVENMEMHVHDFSGNTTPRIAWGPMFNYLKIGTQDYSGQIGQVWYDDVFVGTAPIGCSR